MKTIILTIVWLATASICFGQTKRPITKTTPNQPVASKYGALAVDRSNGFYYGWSSNYATLAEAERKAVEECNKKGGNCTVVLSYSGTGCAAYRTIDGNVGTAFGWGLAKTKEAADAIAMKECLKRSNGATPTNFVWSCNPSNTGTLKEIYNATEEIEVPVKIGNQVWTTKNLNVSTFKNGEPIFYASNQKEWERVSREKIPAYCYLNFDSKNEKKFGKLYNFYAVADRRGLAPEGWHVPSRNEFLTLIAALGGEKVAGVKMRGTKGWDVKDSYNFAHGNGDNSSGLNLLTNGSASGDEYGGGQSFKYGIWLSYWWSATARDDTFAYYLDFNKYSEPRVTDYSKTTGCAVRLVKN